MSGIAYNPNIHIPFYIPNLVAGILYCILLIWGLIVGIYYKQWWFTATFSIGSLIEALGYVGRALGSGDSATYNTDYYTWQLVCLAIAPVFYLAGIYYLLPKLAVVYGTSSSSFSSSSRISRLLTPPVRYLYILLGLDVVSLALLCAGTGYKGSNSEFEETAGRGTGIIIAGFGVQLGGMLVFGILGADVLIHFNKKQKHQNHHSTNSVGVDDEEDGWLTANRFEQQQQQQEQDMMVYDEYESIYEDHRSLHITLLWSIFAATVLIFIRTVFRIIEVSVSKVRSHEAYLLVFDGLLVLIAGFILTVIGHPGRVFDKYSKIPIFKK